ncbi:MAG: hypothetical protein ACK58L_07510 [Planctomycetota bacterium]
MMTSMLKSDGSEQIVGIVCLEEAMQRRAVLNACSVWMIRIVCYHRSEADRRGV